MSSIESLEEAFAAAAGRIEGVHQALDYEPDLETIRMPAITMLWTTLAQDDLETGPRTDNRWTWDVNVYVQLDIGAREAQRQLKRIVVALLALIRDDPGLNDLADQVSISDGGPPVFYAEEGCIHKVLRLTAHTTEH